MDTRLTAKPTLRELVGIYAELAFVTGGGW